MIIATDNLQDTVNTYSYSSEVGFIEVAINQVKDSRIFVAEVLKAKFNISRKIQIRVILLQTTPKFWTSANICVIANQEEFSQCKQK